MALVPNSETASVAKPEPDHDRDPRGTDDAAIRETAERRPEGRSSSISKRWTAEHDQRLRSLAEAGTTKNDIAFELRRTRAAIVSRAALLGIALPKKPRGSAKRIAGLNPVLFPRTRDVGTALAEKTRPR